MHNIQRHLKVYDNKTTIRILFLVAAKLAEVKLISL